MANYTLTYASLGASTGPFDITDQDGNVIASGVSKAELLAGKSLSLGSSVTSIKVASTGQCTNFETIVLGAPATTTTTAAQSTGNVAKIKFNDQTTSTSDCPGGGGNTFYNTVANRYVAKDINGSNITANVSVELTWTTDGVVETPNEVFAAGTFAEFTDSEQTGDCGNTSRKVTAIKVNGVTFVYSQTTDEWTPA
jgi:hypothetical protein